jgi:hypothetical protein
LAQPIVAETVADAGHPPRRRLQHQKVRRINDKFAGVRAAIASFTADGFFYGQNPEFLNILKIMAIEADAAVRST